MILVVTGASGFLGRALLADLSRRGAPVIAVSRRPAPVLPGVETVRVADYAETPRGDVLVHLAEPAALAAAEEAGAAHEKAMLGTLDRLLASGFRRVVYGSSAIVYGDRLKHPRRPDEAPAPAGLYGRTKLAGERMVLAAGGVAVRLANLYGPGMAANNVLSDAMRQLGGAGPLPLRDTAPVRDFLWIGDAAAGLAAVALGEAAGLYNLGTGRGTSIGDLARLLLETAGKAGREIVATAPGGRPSTLVLDIAATEAAFGWRPQTSLASGLRMLLKSAP
jgi:UDP-glucose 4-epimerase